MLNLQTFDALQMGLRMTRDMPSSVPEADVVCELFIYVSIEFRENESFDMISLPVAPLNGVYSK